jgi:signal transduction histidine kinase
VTIGLRTRLYLAVAIILAVSVGVSAVLSRQATLVELRRVVDETPYPDGLAAAAERVQAAITSGGPALVTDALETFRRETARGFVLVDARGQVAAASNPLFIGSTVSASDDGTLRLAADDPPLLVSLRRVPVFSIQLSGAPAQLFVLPAAADLFPGGLRQQPRIAPWLLTAGATGVVALALTFGLARRILRPVGELTDAARRMENGDLTVRVDTGGGDEIAGLARAFNALAARLAENERLRRQMVSDVAHELRSPVTNLRCMLEGVQDGLERADRTTIDALYDETMFLQRLIADLQDLTLADAGSLPLQIGPVQAADVIDRAVSAMNAVPGAPPVAVDVPRGLMVQADADRLEQILRNLLANARQHTPADGRICVTAARVNETVEIAVSDTGAGIATDHLPHVFDRFYRADPSRSRSTGGAGLGLAIVRQLVTAQGGSVTVASDGLGRGATFRVTLRHAAGA